MGTFLFLLCGAVIGHCLYEDHLDYKAKREKRYK